jgi:hypothetical protein
MAEDPVMCELFSAQFPANREKYREIGALVDGRPGDVPICRDISKEKWNLSEIETGN